MSHPVKTPKKLIEVALPLDAINEASGREKSIRHGHPSTLHLWWARRPLAAARAVIFGQMVNDPSWKWEMEHPGEAPPGNLKASWAATRKRLFSLIEELVKWENTTNEEVLERAWGEIRKSWRETCELNKDHSQATELFDPEQLPSFHDPFAGGGAIPLEAQRLGLDSYASDLNPVAVLINKAMIEIPPKFAGRPPVNPEWQSMGEAHKALRQWKGTHGLAEDVRYYGQWIRDEAKKRIGHLYPSVDVTSEMAEARPDLKPLVGHSLPVIAWLWTRTVKSPNPAFRHVDVPIASTFVLSTKEGKEAYVHPVIDGDSYTFRVRMAPPPPEAKNGTKLSRANFKCLLSGTPIAGDHVKAEGRAGRMSVRLMAIVVEGLAGRVCLSPTAEQEVAAQTAQPTWKPEVTISGTTQYLGIKPYGMDRFDQLFTDRQLVALETFSSLVGEAVAQVKRDAVAAGIGDDDIPLEDGGSAALGYSHAVALFLTFILDYGVNYWSTLATPAEGFIRGTYAMQALQMSWDFAEAPPFGTTSGSWSNGVEWAVKAITSLPAAGRGTALQSDATKQEISLLKVVSTDPPYYDNVPYADLSDYFYVWMRHTLKDVFPEVFTTVGVPKADELVAFAYRHSNGKLGAEAFFLDGMTQAMRRLATQAHPAFPVTIYYAFKQAESECAGDTASTGWETFLDAVIRAGFSIGGTWPMRTERSARNRSIDSNALASSIILVCRPRPANAASISRRAFQRELNRILPEALDEMTRGAENGPSPVAPVDLSQAIIGPGMAIFSKYKAVLEADGSLMSLRTALQLINRFLAEDDFDLDTQFCLHWFEQYGWKEGQFGQADTLARAKGTSVEGVKQAGALSATGGIVRLLKWAEYPQNWDPRTDTRLPVWEALHQIIRVFKSDGETGAAAVLAAVQAKAEATRQLAYRLYTLCERAGWAEDARAYNEIITSWSAIEAEAARVPGPKQAELFNA
jgi:putative DNA methylase